MIPKRLLAFILFAALAVMPACGLRAQWVQTNGIYVGNIFSLAVIGTNLFAGIYSSFDGGVFRSTDNGASWTTASNGLSSTQVTSLAAIGSNLFAGIYSSFDGGVFRSTDNGTSWTTASNGLSSTQVTSLAAIGSNLFAGTDGGGVFRSTDSGTSWTGASNGLMIPEVLCFEAIGTNSTSPILFAGTVYGAYRSTDNGTNWTGGSDEAVPCLAVIGTNSSSPILFAGTSGGVLRSTDSGTGWTGSLTNNSVLSLAVIDTNSSSSMLFAGTDDSGVFLSTDSGTSWTWESSGLTNTFVQAFAVIGTNLFAGTEGSGVWRRPLSDFNQLDVAERSPLSNQAIHICPNPFSQSTQITFTAQTAGYADVSILNMLGVEVARLFSGELGVGEHNFLWGNPTGLPEGTYECLVRMNGQVETLPIVLMH